MTMDPWIATLCEQLGVPIDDVDVSAILDLAKDAAHNVERPAAPVTTFIAGYAAATSGGGSAAVDAAIERAGDLAAEWPERVAPPAGTTDTTGTDTTEDGDAHFEYTSTEAGEDIGAILERKETERLASGGTFLWVDPDARLAVAPAIPTLASRSRHRRSLASRRSTSLSLSRGVPSRAFTRSVTCSICCGSSETTQSSRVPSAVQSPPPCAVTEVSSGSSGRA
jgi:hypothetical protein